MLVYMAKGNYICRWYERCTGTDITIKTLFWDIQVRDQCYTRVLKREGRRRISKNRRDSSKKMTQLEFAGFKNGGRPEPRNGDRTHKFMLAPRKIAGTFLLLPLFGSVPLPKDAGTFYQSSTLELTM